jgi:hypothetical protein
MDEWMNEWLITLFTTAFSRRGIWGARKNSLSLSGSMGELSFFPEHQV